MTPALVHNHTIARAREAPFVCLILQWLRLVDITLAILDSARVGERGDYPTYFHMALLMLSFLAVSNAHHYIFTFLTSNRKWAEASDRERFFISKFLFIRLSAYGFPIPTDYFVECVIRDFRHLYGKYWTKDIGKQIV